MDPAPSVQPPALPEPDHLERLVTLVDSAIAPRGWYSPHVLVKVEETDDPESFDLGLKDLPDDAHPVDELWGFVAPATWLAIGVVTFGWASPMDGIRPSAHPDRCRVRATIIVDRSGRQVASASLEDGTCIDEPGEGLIGEVLQLCIGASTPAPPPLEELCDRMWLQQVLDTAEVRRVGWKTIEALRVPVDSSWERLRRMAAKTGKWPFADDWMDDGFFARQVLSGMPTVGELLDELEGRLSTSAWRKLRAAVAVEGEPRGSAPTLAAMAAEIEPPELARLLDTAERPRVGDWSLRAALTRYAQPQPQRASDVFEVLRRIEFALKPHAKMLDRSGQAVWNALQQAAGGATDDVDDVLVELLRTLSDLDRLGDALAAWAVDRATARPDAMVDDVVRDVTARLDEFGVAREEGPPPRGMRGRG